MGLYENARRGVCVFTKHLCLSRSLNVLWISPNCLKCIDRQFSDPSARRTSPLSSHVHHENARASLKSMVGVLHRVSKIFSARYGLPPPPPCPHPRWALLAETKEEQPCPIWQANYCESNWFIFQSELFLTQLNRFDFQLSGQGVVDKGLRMKFKVLCEPHTNYLHVCTIEI